MFSQIVSVIRNKFVIERSILIKDWQPKGTVMGQNYSERVHTLKYKYDRFKTQTWDTIQDMIHENTRPRNKLVSTFLIIINKSGKKHISL